MRTIIQNILMGSLVLLMFSACGDGGGDDPGPDAGAATVAASEVFTGEFTATATGTAAAADFDGKVISFQVTGTSISLQVEGGSPNEIVLLSVGTYDFEADADFSDGNTVTIIRTFDNLPTQATFSQEGQQLVLQFTIPSTPNGKTLGVAGSYTFTLNK